ncbi:hypothetical protein [Nonomuraea longicatena]|uniref:Transcriptional regulator n=1 Tax=Nonomuraea longicatena TaxID=83682 RepID=A0ABP4BUZ9_9ACTN
MAAELPRALPTWAELLREKRRQAGWSQKQLAIRLFKAAGGGISLPELDSVIRRIKDHEAGRHHPADPYPLLYGRVLGLSEAIFIDPPPAPGKATESDEVEALELARRVTASDVGEETLQRLEATVDELASIYSKTPPAALLRRVRVHLGYVSRLLDGKKTLAQHRRLVVTEGWLSLIGATCHIDLKNQPAAAAQLRTARHLAKQAEHPEIIAWCLETEAWQVLIDGDYRRAVTLSQEAQAVAPRGTSVHVQAIAQEGRAWARLGAGAETRDALNRVHGLVSPMRMPDRPEHHYRYDPAKSDAYTATTLAWIGDTAAESYARQVLTRLEAPTDGGPRPRRAASARLDLALALLASGQLEEAGHVTGEAMTSGMLVPSSHWRAAEIIAEVGARGLPEATELLEMYRELRRHAAAVST